MTEPEAPRKDVERAALAWTRYKRMMKWMVLAAAITVGLALWWLGSNGHPMPLHMIVATIAGVGLTVLVGTGLMGLVFLSNSGGHDDEAAGGRRDPE
jgi:F0F1-type ATP synthase assembly protein I